MSISAFVGAVTATSVKGLSFILAPLIVFWISRFFPLVGLVHFFSQKKRPALKTNKWLWHLLFNTLYLSSIATYFYSLSSLPLVDASLLFNAAPLYSPLLSMLFLKEHFPHKLWLYVAISFMGVLFVLQPGSSVFQPMALWAGLSGILMAAAQACNRYLTYHEHHQKIVFYMLILAPLLSSTLFLFDPKLLHQIEFQSILNPFYLLLLIVAGVSTWLYQLFRTKAVAQAPVALVMPFSYLATLFAGAFDWFFFDVTPTLLSLIGFLLVVIGNFFLLRSKISAR